MIFNPCGDEKKASLILEDVEIKTLRNELQDIYSHWPMVESHCPTLKAIRHQISHYSEKGEFICKRCGVEFRVKDYDGSRIACPICKDEMWVKDK